VSLLDYDFNQPEIPPEVRLVLRNMGDKYRQYKLQGRLWEANGIAKGFRMLARAYSPDFQETEPTGWGSL
jgi:hypothetical protein